MHMERESEFRAWDELAPDVLVLVFKKLDLQELLEAIPLVCKSWCNVVKGPYCWDKVEITEWSWTNRSIPVKIDRKLQTLIRRSSGMLRELSVAGLNDQSLFFLIEHVGSLQTLALYSCTVSDSIVELMAPRLSSLTSLTLFSCNKLSTRALEAIGTNCKALVSLTWDNMGSHKDEALTISRVMPKLKHLSFGQSRINNLIVRELLSGCPELELLDIRASKSDKLDWKFLEENFPKLKVEAPYTSDDSDDQRQ